MALCTEKIEAFLQLTEEMETEDLYRKAVEWRKLYEKGISSQKSISVTEKDSFQGCGGGVEWEMEKMVLMAIKIRKQRKQSSPSTRRKWWKIIKMSYNWWALKVSPINTWAHEQNAVQISTGKWCKIDRPRDRRFLKRAQKANTRRYNRTCTTTLSLLYLSRSFSLSRLLTYIWFVRNNFSSAICNSWLNWLNINRKLIVQNESFARWFFAFSLYLTPPLSLRATNKHTLK